MDPGHFLTGSGSKIPMPKTKKENMAPVKPKLTTSTVETTNYIGSNLGEVVVSEKNKQKQPIKSKATVNLKTTTSNSVPNLTKSAVLVRSKTNLNLKGQASAAGIKRSANPTETTDVPAIKQSKSTSKMGFQYKAKNWELKARLSECESWVNDLQSKCLELQAEFNDDREQLKEAKCYLNDLIAERSALTSEVTNLRNNKEELQEKLRSRNEEYDKLLYDSKQFIEKIERLEVVEQQKDKEISILQSDQSKLREDLLTRDSNISQLRFTVDDLEFKTKRQDNQIQDLEKTVEQLRKENVELQNHVRNRNEEIAVLQDKLDKSERDNRLKSSSLSDLDFQYIRSREDIMRLEKELRDMKCENRVLREELDGKKSELAVKKQSEESLSKSCEELKEKLCESEKLRRYLHNSVQDLKGNIRVFCRVRPPISSERENSIPLCSINFPDEGSLEISKGDPFGCSKSTTSRPKFIKHEFSFDRVFNPTATQQDVFDELSQLVQSALDGYNVCVFAYGQTGSGKTYTMEGENSRDLRGMIPRTVDHIFKSLSELELIGWEYVVEVSFIEIYNEIVKDLLRNDKEGSSLKIMQVDGKTNDVIIPGLTVMKVDSYEDLDRLYLLAHQNRAVAYTVCNERSSRSHSVTRIKVTGTHKGRGEKCYGSLYLVDLAGSERLNEPMSDPRFREMKNINKSLSELGNVILGLMQKQEYIPYRNSKLTHLLQPALGGSSKTLMLVNISPAEHCLQETLCSLRFAEKVNKVKMGVTKKRVTCDNANLK